MSELAERLRWGVIWLLGTAIACSMAVKLWPHMHVVPAVLAQGNTKTVIINELRRNDPIEVVKVLGAAKEAAVGAPAADDLKWWPDGGHLTGRVKEWRVAYKLQSDDSWLNTLSFVLRNRTSKKIGFVAIGIFSPQAGLKTGSEFSFGQLPAVVAYTGDGKPIPPTTRKPISFDPGQEITFTLADDQNHLDRLISNAEPLSGTSIVYVDFQAILEDGVAWREYQYSKPDPAHPGQGSLIGGSYFPGPLTGPPAPCHGTGRRGCL